MLLLTELIKEKQIRYLIFFRAAQRKWCATLLGIWLAMMFAIAGATTFFLLLQ